MLTSRFRTNKGLEEAERRYQELFAAEKQRLRKKEEQSRDIINQMNKKLKVIQLKLNRAIL